MDMNGNEIIKRALRMLKSNFSYNTLISSNYTPTSNLQEIVSEIIPGVHSNDLNSLKIINDLLQEVFFKPHNGKFRYEIWKPGDSNVSFKSEKLNPWLQRSLREENLSELFGETDTFLVLGSTLQNFCKRTSFLLKELATVAHPHIKKLAVLGGNRFVTSQEKEYFKNAGFIASEEIIFESDFMDAIINKRDNVQKILEAQNNFDKERCLNAYDSIKEIVCIDTVYPTNKPTTFDTVVDYLKVTDVTNESIVIVSSQPYIDYQSLTTLSAFLKAKVLPKKISGIGSGVPNVSAILFGNHVAKLLYTKTN